MDRADLFAVNAGIIKTLAEGTVPLTGLVIIPTKAFGQAATIPSAIVFLLAMLYLLHNKIYVFTRIIFIIQFNIHFNFGENT
jgi:hypothetical protein